MPLLFFGYPLCYPLINSNFVNLHLLSPCLINLGVYQFYWHFPRTNSLFHWLFVRLLLLFCFVWLISVISLSFECIESQQEPCANHIKSPPLYLQTTIMLTLGGTTDIQYVTNRAEHDRMGRKWTRIMAPYRVLGEHPSTAQNLP